MKSRQLEGNCSNPTAINVCKRRLMTCCHLCTSSRFGLSSSPNHRLSCVIIDQSQYRKFYHTYRYYLRGILSHLPILLAVPLWPSRDFVWYTAISINVVGLNLQTYKSRSNGAMGIYCNLHNTIEEIYKFVFLHVEYLFFFP